VRAAPVHDVCAVLAVTHPQLLVHEPRAVAVELTGQHTRGMTVVDERPPAVAGGATEPASGTTVEVGYAVDAPAARALLLDAILHPGSG
jgi:inosine-uridine nucleoside N-ribohydrolase